MIIRPMPVVRHKIGHGNNVLAASVRLRYESLAQMAFEGADLTFLLPEKENDVQEETPGQITMIFQLYLQEIYYRSHKNLLAGQKEALKNIRWAVGQKLQALSFVYPIQARGLRLLYERLQGKEEWKALRYVESVLKTQLYPDKIQAALKKADEGIEALEKGEKSSASGDMPAGSQFLQPEAQSLYRERETLLTELIAAEQTLKEMIAAQKERAVFLNTEEASSERELLRNYFERLQHVLPKIREENQTLKETLSDSEILYAVDPEQRESLTQAGAIVQEISEALGSETNMEERFRSLSLKIRTQLLREEEQYRQEIWLDHFFSGYISSLEALARERKAEDMLESLQLEKNAGPDAFYTRLFEEGRELFLKILEKEEPVKVQAALGSLAQMSGIPTAAPESGFELTMIKEMTRESFYRFMERLLYRMEKGYALREGDSRFQTPTAEAKTESPVQTISKEQWDTIHESLLGAYSENRLLDMIAMEKDSSETRIQTQEEKDSGLIGYSAQNLLADRYVERLQRLPLEVLSRPEIMRSEGIRLLERILKEAQAEERAYLEKNLRSILPEPVYRRLTPLLQREEITAAPVSETEYKGREGEPPEKEKDAERLMQSISKEQWKNIYELLMGAGNKNGRTVYNAISDQYIERLQRLFAEALSKPEATLDESIQILGRMVRAVQEQEREPSGAFSSQIKHRVLWNVLEERRRNGIAEEVVKYIKQRSSAPDGAITGTERISRSLWEAFSDRLEFRGTADLIPGTEISYRKVMQREEIRERTDISETVRRYAREHMRLHNEDIKNTIHEVRQDNVAHKKELAMMRSEIKEQQRIIEELKKADGQMTNPDDIYRMIMKKMESQIRLERLRRGLR